MEQVTASREALDRTYDLLNYAECSHEAHTRFALYYDESEAEKTALRQAKDEEIARLVEELRLWRMLVNEGGVPRYTVTPGAALNTIVTSTDAMLRRYPNA